MLIGVQLPITEDNVKNIDAHQLLKAHDMFLHNALTDKHKLNVTFEKQYLHCRDEILKRLIELEKSK